MELRTRYQLRLALRLGVFLAGLGLYRFRPGWVSFDLSRGITPMHVLWAVLLGDMIYTLLPGAGVSRGRLKQYGRHEAPPPQGYDAEQLRRVLRAQDARAAVVMALWLLGNGIFAALYRLRILAEREMILLMLAYYAGDMVCVVWWCPFQRIFLKNRCCVTCRIYNWDRFFLVTPMAVVPGFFAKSLFAAGTLTLLIWEWNRYRHPQRFWEGSNMALRCQSCREPLCRRTGLPAQKQPGETKHEKTETPAGGA
ncbi:MAG: hypothetical protein PHO66_01100 [Eubacteriales bacterium]|nr:hypothetical protein [Eubacteriales bacterium]